MFKSQFVSVTKKEKKKSGHQGHDYKGVSWAIGRAHLLLFCDWGPKRCFRWYCFIPMCLQDMFFALLCLHFTVIYVPLHHLPLFFNSHLLWF